MGTCPNTAAELQPKWYEKPFTTCYNNWDWIDPNSRLPPLNAEKNSITVSGFASGATMASQFNVAYSEFIKGAGLVAGGPYATSPHILAWEPELSTLTGIAIETAKYNANEGTIDNLGFLYN